MITELSLLIAWSSSGFRNPLGIVTWIPCWRKGVTTIKMISNTSMISTMGVTLISDCSPPPPPACIPMIKNSFLILTAVRSRCGSRPNYRLQLWVQLLRAVLDKVIDEFRGRIVHLDDKAVDLTGEIVEQPDRRDRNHQAERCGEQGFRNTAGHGRDTRCLSVLHAAERVNDAEHRAEQPDEGSGRTDGCQP